MLTLLAITLLLLVGATVVTAAGRAITTSRLAGSGTVPQYVAWGTGAGTAAVADTGLFTEASEARVAGSLTQQTTSTTNDTFQVVGTMIVAGSGKTITNAGLFDASSGGNLFLKGDFTGVVLNVGESIQFSFRVQYA
jgi:stage V sporulation protein SpoVS